MDPLKKLRLITLFGFAILSVSSAGCGGKTEETPGSANDLQGENAGTVTAIPPQVSQASAQTITSEGIGPARLGMTFGELKQALGQDFTLQDNPSFTVDWGAIAILQQGTVQFYALYPAGTPPQDGDPVELVMTEHPDFATAAGVKPGMLISEAVAIYGSPTISYNVDDEFREYVGFANAPQGLYFRTNGFPRGFIGMYSGSGNGGYHETQAFDPDGKVASIWVGKVNSPVVQAVPAQVPSRTPATTAATSPNASASASAPNCSNPQTTEAVNSCAEQAYQAADDRLNQTYQDLTNQLSVSAKDQLTDVQLAWIQFRDAHCQAVTDNLATGEGRDAFLYGCLAEVTEVRIGQLLNSGQLAPSDQRNTGLGRVTVDGQEVDCDNPLGTPVINYCAGLAYEQADRELNDIYQRLTASLDASAKDQLTDAQLAWLTFRDRHCDFETREAQGGTGYEAYRNNCLEDLTRARTQQLVDWLTL